MDARIDGRLFLCLAPLLWAGNFVVGRALGPALDPFDLNLARWLLAALILLPAVLAERRVALAAIRSHGPQLLALGALGVALFNWVLYAGLARTSASVGGLIFGLTPALILILSRVWQGTAPAAREVGGGALAFAGVATVILARGTAGDPGAGVAGPLLVLVAAAIWAGYTVGLRCWRLPLSPVAGLGLTVLAGLFLLLPVAALRGTALPAAAMAPGVAGGIAYLALGASVVAFHAWQAGVARVGPARAGIYLQLVPAFSVLLGAAFLGEPAAPAKVIGLALIAGGIWLAEGRGLRARGEAQSFRQK